MGSTVDCIPKFVGPTSMQHDDNRLSTVDWPRQQWCWQQACQMAPMTVGPKLGKADSALEWSFRRDCKDRKERAGA